ncbi:actin-10-like [Ciconia maguari]
MGDVITVMQVVAMATEPPQAGLRVPEPALDAMGAKPVERYKALCAVTIDTGTGHTRSWLAGDEQPRTVTDWDGLEELWHRVLYRELGVCPKEVAVLATDAPLSPATNQEKVAELIFKGFSIPAMLVLPRSLLAAYSCGRTASVVVGCRASTSYAAWVREGYVLPHAAFCLDVARDALALYLALEGALRLHPAGAGGVLPLALPGASGLLLGDERFCCPEALLAPTGLGLLGPGLLEQVAGSLRCCRGPPAAPCPALLLVGCTTLLRGFPWRLDAELGVPSEAAPCHRAAAWLGGSLATSLDAFQGAWVLRDEGSPAAVHPCCC